MKRLIVLFLLLLHVPPAISDDDDDFDEFPLPPPPPLTNRYMKVVNPGAIYKPDKDNALIIFERVYTDYSQKGRKTIYKIWDITHNNQPKLVAMLSGGMKAAYRVKPGSYKFMVVLHIRNKGFAPFPFIGMIAWDLGGVQSYPETITAEVVADKTYFVQTQMNNWSERHHTIAVKKGQKTTTTTDNISVLLPIAEGYQERAFYDNSVLLDAVKASDFLNKLEGAQKMKYVLHPEDGR